jgi:hypothetical protein
VLVEIGARERGYMGLWPASARTGAGCPGLHGGAGCPGWGGRMSGAGTGPSLRFWHGGAGFPGRWRRISGGSWGAGCPGSGRMSGPCSFSCGWALRVCDLQGPDVRAKGRMSGAWKLSWLFSLLRDSVFFRLRFQASLADGVVARRCRHSSSSSVKLRQYLCMHTRGVSSSIPSSKGSSEHV